MAALVVDCGVFDRGLLDAAHELGVNGAVNVKPVLDVDLVVYAAPRMEAP